MRLRFGDLWRQRDFLKLWAGQTVSLFGSELTELALPLTAVLVLGATPVQMGLQVAAQTLPELLFGLLAGAWVDRLRRRPLMIAADLGRAVLLVSVPIAAAAGWLSMLQLYVVGFGAGLLSVLFNVAYEAALPSLVARGRLIEANSRLEVSRSVAQVAGPGLAGILVQTITAPATLLLDAFSFVVSAVSIWLIRTPEPAPVHEGQRPSLWGEIGEGLRVLSTHRLLRSVAASSAMLNGFGGLHGAVVVLFLVRQLDLQPAVIGGLRAFGSVWWLPGALLTGWIVHQLGQGPTIALGAALIVLASAALVLAGLFPGYAVPILGLGGIAIGLANPFYNITSGSLRQAVTPDRLLGRVSASMNFAGVGVLPLGALVGGYLGQSIGLWPTLVVASLGQSLALVWLLASPMRRLREAPTPTEPMKDATGTPSASAELMS